MHALLPVCATSVGYSPLARRTQLERTSGSYGLTPSFTVEDQKGNCSGSCSLGQTAPGLLLPTPGHFPHCKELSWGPAKTLGSKMSGGREVSDYFLLPPYSTGVETEAQTCVG